MPLPTVKDIQKILEANYSPKVWLDFIKENFTNNQLFLQPQHINIGNPAIIKECKQLGTYTAQGGSLVGFVVVSLQKDKKLSRNRVGLRNAVNQLLNAFQAVMVVFTQEGESQWRFSYISKRKVRKGDEISDFETAPKRYTYLFGENEKALTAAQRFEKLIQKQALNNREPLALTDFEEAFSVEKLSKEFFTGYKNLYLKFCNELSSEPNIYTVIFNNQQKDLKDFVKRLLGRLVFLYFVQKKGWLGGKVENSTFDDGNLNFLSDMFQKYSVAGFSDVFYNECLEKLFFETLNKERLNNEAEFLGIKYKIPYLNGGLFDQEELLEGKILTIKGFLFEEIFSFFNSFNFTVIEDSPEEQTVAVDPEMLGHIFENLLEGNKQTGAFYTPKEIVHFMCQESLVEYLCTKIGASEKPNLEILIKQLDEISSTQYREWLQENNAKLIPALESVKICDPAIGSGAFPMGLLQEIFNALVECYNEKGWEKQNEAKIKKNIIQESIYGVDIEAGAVDIARLRFWLSLVIDEKEPKPLPNLDFKIMVGNSLIGIYRSLNNIEKVINIKWNDKQTIGSNKELKHKIFTDLNSLAKLRKEYFNPLTNKHSQLYKIKKLQNQVLIDNLKLEKIELTHSRNVGDIIGGSSKSEIESKLDFDLRLAELNKIINELEDSLKQSRSLNYFEWKFSFSEIFDGENINQSGFDIVIGNPPYVQLQKDGGRLGELYKNQGFQTFEKTGDIYALFYEKGTQLLKENGVLSYITSNKWMRANYGKSLRKFLLEKTKVLNLIDLAGQKIFDATVDTNILFLANTPPQSNKPWPVIATKIDESFKRKDFLAQYVKQKHIELEGLQANDTWVVQGKEQYELTKYVKEIGTPLSDKSKWNITINRGVLTGLNEAFIIDETTKNNLIAEDPKSAGIIHPILRGKDIKAWKGEQSLYLIGTHNGYINNPRIELENYPAIKRHLDSFGERLSKRTDKGTTPYNLRDCAYWQDFQKPKIIYPNMTKYVPFLYDKKGYYTNDKGFILLGHNISYLAAILNSEIFKGIYRDFFPELLGGTREIRKVFFEHLPILYPDPITYPNLEPTLAKFTEYLSWLHQDAPTNVFGVGFAKEYLEEVMNGIVYEAYFPAAFKEHNFSILNELPPLPAMEGITVEQLYNFAKEIFATTHPIRNVLYRITNIPQIRFIKEEASKVKFLAYSNNPDDKDED